MTLAQSAVAGKNKMYTNWGDFLVLPALAANPMMILLVFEDYSAATA